MDPKTIRLHENDNVVTAKSEIDINIKIEDEDLSTKQHIPVGHKIATQNINQGDEKYKLQIIIQEKYFFILSSIPNITIFISL